MTNHETQNKYYCILVNVQETRTVYIVKDKIFKKLFSTYSEAEEHIKLELLPKLCEKHNEQKQFNEEERTLTFKDEKYYITIEVIKF